MCLRYFITLITFYFCNIIFAQEPKLMLPIGNTLALSNACFSPDGKKVLTSSQDGTAKIWDAQTGMLIADLKEHIAIIWEASFSPDGKKIVTASLDQTAKIWDAQTGILIADLKGHTQMVLGASFSADSKKIVTTSFDKTAKIWNANTGTLLNELKGHTEVLFPGSFSPNGKYIVTPSADSTAGIWDAISGQRLATLKGHQYEIRVAVFSPVGSKIATAPGDPFRKSKDLTAKIWDAETSSLLFDLIGHTGSVTNVAFSPDGERIVTSSHDSTSKIWDANTGSLVASLKGHTNSIISAQFSPDGKFVVTASVDGTAKLWNSDNGHFLTSLNGHTMGLKSACYSPNGKLIVTASTDQTAKVWNAISGELIANLKGHTNKVIRTSLSPNRKYIVTASWLDSTAKVWNANTGQLITILRGHESTVSDVNFSPDGKYIVTASIDQTAKIWNAINGVMMANLKGHTDGLYHAIFSPSGKVIVTSADSTAKIWDSQTGELVADIMRHTSTILHISFSPDGKYFATSSQDKTAKVWNASNGDLIADLKGHNAKVWNSSFSPDGNNIVTVSADKSAKLWNIKTGDLIADFKGHKNDVLSASFSADGKKIITSSWDSTAKVWDANSGEVLKHFKGKIGGLNKAVFSPEGDLIFTSSKYGDYGEVWNAQNGTHIRTIEGGYDVLDFKEKRILNHINSTINIFDLQSGGIIFSLIAVDSSDYLIVDKHNRYDGTLNARKLLYFTCGSEIIELAQVKDQLWVPNLAERIMNGETINAQKLSDLNICNLTPVVDTIEQTALKYRFQITPRLGGLGVTIVNVNGIEVKRYTPQQLIKQKEGYYLAIDKKELQKFFVAGKENNIVVKSLTAKNSISSRSASISEKGNEKSVSLPNLYAVVVGVSDYKGEELDLKFAAKDAVDIGNALDASTKKFLNTDSKEHVFIYKINTEAGRDKFPEKNSIKEAFTDIAGKAQPNDILLFFFAGHGVIEAEKNQFYFLTADASGITVREALKDVGISTDELTEWIKPQIMKAQKRILIFDACNSGQAIKEIVSIGKKDQNFLAARGDEKSQQIKAVEKLNERSGMFILSASASNQKAYEMGKYNQGALTYSLLKAIKEEPGILEDRKYLNISRWFNAVEKTVNELARETGARQQPQVVSTTNFNIGVVDEEVRNKIVLPFEKFLFTRSDFRNTTLRIDNLKLRALVDKQLDEISGNSKDASIMYSPEYDGANVYAISGDYTVIGNEINVSVILTKGGTEIKTKLEIKETIANQEGLSRQITTCLIDWLKKK